MSAQELPPPREPRTRRSPSVLLLLAGLGVGALALVFWTVVDGELDPGDAPPAAAPAGRPLPPVPRPEDSRAQTQRVGRKILAHPVIGAGYLAQLLSEGSTGRFPAATRRRRALADELAAALSGHHLTGDQVLAVARALAAAANSDGLAPQELTAHEAA
ncbi:MAG: hypothetical protein HZA54_20405, partial [Planctomycetes bacterium]|nr:hypothetical protein [Planctomycetota bacterium]